MKNKVDVSEATMQAQLMDNRELVASLVSLQLDMENVQQELKSLQTRRDVCQEKQEKGEREGGKDLQTFKEREKRLEEENLAVKENKQLRKAIENKFKEQKKVLKDEAK
ncbi:unnamed protein product [Merluccius merluccius]